MLTISANLVDDSGVSSSDQVTNNGTVTGQIQNGIGLVSVKGGLDQTLQSNFATLVPSARPNGEFTLTQSALQGLAGGSLADGAHVLHLLATDQVGSSVKFDLSFILDRTGPSLSAGLVSDRGVSPADGLTNDATVSGQVSDSNGIADLRAGFDHAPDGHYTSVLSLVKSDGTFTLTSALLQSLANGSLTDGEHTLHLVATDRAGNASGTDVSFVLDTAAPRLSADLVVDSGSSKFDQLTNNPTISGQVHDTRDLAALTVGLDQAPSSSYVDLLSGLKPNGKFTITPDLLQTLAGGALVDGAHTIHLIASDKAGNSSTFDLSFILDTTAPAVTPQYFPDAGQPSVTGTVTDANGIASFQVGLDGTRSNRYVDLTSLLQADGSFKLSDRLLNSLAGGLLSTGNHTLHLRATDRAGNATQFDLSFLVESARAASLGETTQRYWCQHH